MALKNFARLVTVITSVAIVSTPAMANAQSPTQTRPDSPLPRGVIEVSGTLQSFGPYFTLNGVEVDAGARWWRVNTQAPQDIDGNGTRQSWDAELRGLVGKNVRLLAEADDYDYDLIEINGVAMRSPWGPPPWAGGPRGEWRGGSGGQPRELRDWQDWSEDEDWFEERYEDWSSPVAPRERVVGRSFAECSRGSMMEVDLELEGRRFEVDIEIYGDPRERWNMTIGTPARVTHTLSRVANREGEVNAWRYMPASTKSIEVRATSQNGENCRVTVGAQ